MNKKDLIDLGIAEDLVEQVIVLHGKGIESHKATITTMQTELDGLKMQLTEAGTTIEGFKKLDVDAIKAAADDYKAKFEQATTESASQLASLKFDHALESALTGAKAKNVKAVQALLSRDVLKLNDDGSILGLKEQLEKIKSENDYLFTDEKVIPKIVTNTNNKSVLSDPLMVAARKAAGLEPEQT